MLFTICTLLSLSLSSVSALYSVKVTGDTNVVVGGTVRLKATVFEDGRLSSGSFKYTWEDNAIPQHTQTEESKDAASSWNVTYTQGVYAPGSYNIQLGVEKKDWFGIYEYRTSYRGTIEVTAQLSGMLQVSQKSVVRTHYVETNSTAVHDVYLSDADATFLHENKPQILSYWFMDCEYLGVESGLSRNMNYTRVGSTQYVEVLVVASAMPPPPPTTTTTTTPPTTTSTSTTPSTTTSTTASPNATTTTTTTATPPTTAPITTSTTTVSLPITTAEPDVWMQWISQFPVRNASEPAASGFCLNLTTVPMSPNSTYGYFQKKLVAKAPVRLVSINGSNWLQDGDVLNIGLSCKGSGPFNYCVQLATGQYNITGNETCEAGKAKPLTDCGLTFGHLFTTPQQYTLVFIISNDVSKLVTPVGVNVYKVTKQPQLSVIIVPVVFSIVAVVLIIFGFAWCIQSRRSFTVEVADFDFGQQPSELEYKTFTERLRESVMHSFFRTEDPAEADNAWSPSRKYGSMQ